MCNLIKKTSVLLSLLLITACVRQKQMPNQQAYLATIVKLGFVYLQRNEKDLARKQFLRALKVKPNSALAWQAWAYYQDQIGEFIKARQAFKHALYLAPKQAALHNNYGVFLCRHGHYRPALRELKLAAQTVSYVKHQQALHNLQYCQQAWVVRQS